MNFQQKVAKSVCFGEKPRKANQFAKTWNYNVLAFSSTFEQKPAKGV